MSVFLLSVILALSISAICSLMEATLLSLTPTQIAEMSRARPTVGMIWQKFKSNVERPIAVILMLNTAAHTIGASIAGAQFDDLFGDQWILLFSLIFTLLMLQFTEILPKTMGVRYNREIATLIARPLSMMVVAFTPLLHVVRWVNRPFEGRGRTDQHQATVEEIAALAGLARLTNQISPYQERIIQGASRMSHLPVEELMIPAEQVSFLSTTQTLSEAILTAHVEAHTRFPVCEEGDPDRVVGYVNFKEMIYSMRTNPQAPGFLGIIRPVRFVRPGSSAAALLQGFVSEHVHMAIVRSAEGRTLGLVTFEDVVEELVGELEDEFDRLPRMLHSLTGGTWMVGGGTPVSEVAESTGVELPAANLATSAWLLERLEQPPRPGDSCRVGPLEFVVRRVRRGRIFEAAVYRRAGE
ncbi:MAG: HlyC/CorC family transporter [Planctomyces sp.]|nr:HlyC/CorC family transporter [Planctomyces sp.]